MAKFGPWASSDILVLVRGTADKFLTHFSNYSVIVVVVAASVVVTVVVTATGGVVVVVAT